MNIDTITKSHWILDKKRQAPSKCGRHPAKELVVLKVKHLEHAASGNLRGHSSAATCSVNPSAPVIQIGERLGHLVTPEVHHLKIIVD
jgi:hypothetical protein